MYELQARNPPETLHCLALYVQGLLNVFKRRREEEMYNQLFTELEVVPYTIKQNTPEWFLLWTPSFTSSTELDDEFHSFIGGTTRGALSVVLTMIYCEGLDQRVNSVMPPQSPNPSMQRAGENQIVSGLMDDGVVSCYLEKLGLSPWNTEEKIHKI